MAFFDRILDPPTYGYERDGRFYAPTHREIFREFFRRTNPFTDRKNWLPFLGWFMTLSFAIPLVLFFVFYFKWSLALVGLFYAMVFLGTHGTIWLHRYSTHRAFQFRNPFARFICRNLVLKIIPEEIYVVSHHVHHHRPEMPGDPYNVNGGWLYCFLADVNHQTIRKDLSEEDYKRVCKLLSHTGVRMNSYSQYQYWGSVCRPVFTISHYLLNWIFWFGIFYWLGGISLALAIFGMAGVWAVGVRTFNYEGHGKGQDRRRIGIDFNRKDFSVNQWWPGYVAGEWHNNHHLYPHSARCGFLNYQLDLAWVFIRGYSWLGGITSFQDCKEDFFRDYYRPFLKPTPRTVTAAVAATVVAESAS